MPDKQISLVSKRFCYKIKEMRDRNVSVKNATNCFNQVCFDVKQINNNSCLLDKFLIFLFPHAFLLNFVLKQKKCAASVEIKNKKKGKSTQLNIKLKVIKLNRENITSRRF